MRDTKEERSIRDSIVKKIMKGMHMSKLEAIETMQIFKSIFSSNLYVASHIAVFLELGDKEIEFLTEDKEKVGKIKGKMLSIHRKLKEVKTELEVKVEEVMEKIERVEEEARETEEVEGEVEIEEPEESKEEELDSKDQITEEKKDKKGKQVTLFDFLKK